MDKNCLVSYLMTVYNDEDHLKQSVESVLNQTWKNLELIIVNDGSTDSSRQILETITDHRCIVIQRDENKGRSYSLNEGLKHCSGDVVFINDSDDIALKNRTDVMMEYVLELDLNKWGLIASSSMINQNGQKSVYRLRKNLFSHIQKGSVSKAMLYLMNPFVHSTVVYNKKALNSIGGFASEVSGGIDYLTYLKISKHFSLHGVSDILEERCIHQTNYFEKKMNQREKKMNRSITLHWINKNVFLGFVFVLGNRIINELISPIMKRMRT